MNKTEIELKQDFEFFCSNLVKWGDVWEFQWSVLDINEETTYYFEPMFQELLQLLNEDDSELIDMETDDIYDMLFENEVKHNIK